MRDHSARSMTRNPGSFAYGPPPLGHVTRRHYAILITLAILSTVLSCGILLVQAGWINLAPKPTVPVVFTPRPLITGPPYLLFAAVAPAQPINPPQPALDPMAAQHHELDDLLTPNSIVYDEDPEEAARFAGSTDYSSVGLVHYEQMAVGDCDRCDGSAWLAMLPGFWHEPVARTAPQAWVNIQPELNDESWTANALFLHEMVSPGGHQRLIHVGIERMPALDIEPFPFGFDPKTYHIKSLLNLNLSVIAGSQRISLVKIQIGSWRETDAIVWKHGNARQPEKVYSNSANHLRVYAGSVAPRDSSHFSIRFELADHPLGNVDFFLQDDDSVKVVPGIGKITHLNSYCPGYAEEEWDYQPTVGPANSSSRN